MGTSRFRQWSVLPAAGLLLPLAFGPFLRDPFETPKLAAAGLLGAAGLLLLAAQGRLFTARSRVDLPLAAFALAVLISAGLSVDRQLCLYGSRLDYVYGLAGLGGCLAAFRLGCAETPEGARRFAGWAVAASLPVALYALLQAALPSWLSAPLLRFGSLAWEAGSRGPRAASTLGTPVSLGAYLAVVAPLALRLSLDRSGRKGVRAASGAALAVGVAALLFSGSRGAWLAALAGCAAAAAPFLRRERLRPSVLAGIVAVAALFVLALRARVGASASDSFRGQIWRAALRQQRDAPVVGSGPATFIMGFRQHETEALARLCMTEGFPRNAHDDVLEALVTTGVLGLAAYAWLNVAAAREALRAARQRPDAAAFVGAALAAGVVAKVDPPFLAAAWLACACAGCALALPPEPGKRLVLSRGVTGLAVAGSLWCAWAGWSWLRAERLDLLGRVARAEGRPREAVVDFEEAVAARPATAAYVEDLDNELWDAASALPARARGPLLEGAALAARDAALRRPLDSELWLLLGQAEQRRVEWAGEPRQKDAANAFAMAKQLEPFRETQKGG